MNTISRLILKYRNPVIAIVIILSLSAGLFIPRLKINPDVFGNLPKDDPAAVFFNRVGEEFGGNYTCVIGLETEDVFNRGVFEALLAITDSIRYMEGVGQITSLANVLDIRSGEWGIEIGRLVDEYEMPVTEEEYQALKEYTLSKDLYRGRLVSEDATMTILAVMLEEGSNKVRAAGEIRRKIESMSIPAKLYFGGQPFVIAAFGKVIQRDLMFIGPVCLLLILLVLYIGFRNTQGVLLPILTVLTSLLWTFGLMGLLGIEISIITSVIPILLIAVGSAYTIHVLNRIYETPGDNQKERVATAWSYISVPVIFTSVTTIFGFISFIFGSYLYMIRIFGLFTSVGIFFSMLLSLVLIPGLLPGRLPGAKKKQSAKGMISLSRLLAWTSSSVLHHPVKLLLSWLIFLALISTGIFRIGRNADFMEYFPKTDPNRITEQVLKKKMGGTSPVYVSVKGDVFDPEVMRIIHETQEVMEQDPSLIHTQSVADLFIQMNEVMGEGQEVPETREKIGNLWFLIEGQDILEQLLSKDRQEAIIQGTFSSSDIEKSREFIERMEAFFSDQADAPVSFELSGLPSLISSLDRSLIKSQFRSLAIAIILVFMAVSLLQRSLMKGFFSTIPILATLVILYGFMGWAGIALDIATVLVGSISIGIGIDYSIHVINHFSHEAKVRGDVHRAIESAIRISGKSILINMFSVSAGFIVLVLSTLIPLVRFGILVAITMFASGTASLTLLPAMLLVNQRISKKFLNNKKQNV